MLCTSGFVDDVMFSFNAGTTCMFRRVRQVTAPVGRQTTLFGARHWGQSLPSPTAPWFALHNVK